MQGTANILGLVGLKRVWMGDGSVRVVGKATLEQSPEGVE